MQLRKKEKAYHLIFVTNEIITRSLLITFGNNIKKIKIKKVIYLNNIIN